MDQRLAEAARVGDIIALHRILEEDPEILEKASLAHFADSPLHVAALRGKADFVKQIVTLMPSLTTATNQKGLIPLHMASAQGHVEIVKELLKVKGDKDQVNQCLVKDEDGWTALHYAVFKGRVGVIKELIKYYPQGVEEVTAKGETVLHLGVKANQFEAVKVIVERIKRFPDFQTLFRAKDINGNTVYNLAAAKKQFRVILDIGKEEEKNEVKEETRITMEVEIEDEEPEAPENKEREASGEAEAEKNKKKEFENAILIVATLIITLTYQGLSNPPSSLFQPGKEIDWSCMFPLFPKGYVYPGIREIRKCPARLATFFLVMNTLIFIESIILLLLSLRGRPGFLLLLRLLACFLTYSYCVLLVAFSYYAAYFVVPLVALAGISMIVAIVREDWFRDIVCQICRNPRQHVLEFRKCMDV